MNGKILVTDSLFIFDEHVKKLKDAGYEVERLDKPEATEDELCEAIKGKVGYILGGIEKVTNKVLDSADELKIIIFTGIDYKNFIPGWESAEQKGIKIFNIPDGPTQAVAEWAIGATLLMNRGFIELGRTGHKTFGSTSGIQGQSIGIIGFGRIGKRIATMIKEFKPSGIAYWSPHSRDAEGHLEFKELEELLSTSDILYLAVPAAAEGLLSENLIMMIKQDALLVTFTHGKVIDEGALLNRLQDGTLRAVSDDPIKSDEYEKLPTSTWFCFNGSNAFNTKPGIKRTSDKAVELILDNLKLIN